MEIEFDPAKDSANIAKHGVSLADASHLFRGELRIFEDLRKDYGERRFIAMGLIKGRLYVCVFTIRGKVRRVISLRKANRREQDAYKAAAENETGKR